MKSMAIIVGNYSRMAAASQNTTPFNLNIMEFCMSYLEHIRSRNLSEGEEILQILAIVLQRKISVATEVRECGWKCLPATAGEASYPEIYLHHVDVSSDTAKPSNHYNVILML